MEHVIDLLDSANESLGRAAKSDVVAGEPMEIGGVTFVPLSRVSVGLGAGGGSGEEAGPHSGKGGRHGKGEGAGSGAGATVRPVAVVVMSTDGVEVLTIPDKQGKLEKLLEKIPDLVERFAPQRSK